MTKGTLRILVHRDDRTTQTDIWPLRWKGVIPGGTFSAAVDKELWISSDAPLEPGLWLLTWDWFEEYTGDDELSFDFSSNYEWRRPTLADLIALGALPEEPDHA